MNANLAKLVERVRSAFAGGPPNGWIEEWAMDRHFSEFVQVVSPQKASNVTSFDYSFCNRFEVQVEGLGDRCYAVLTVLLSFIADVYTVHWTLYERGGRVGRVVEAPPSEDAVKLQLRVEKWLAQIGFTRLRDDWYDIELNGILLELSGETHVTLGKCLFQDFDG
jgi:hypothetical protein